MILNPNQETINLTSDLAGSAESTYLTVIADDSVHQVERITPATVAATTTGDYVIVTKPDGDVVAIWLDKAGTNSAPSGPIFDAADVKVRVNVSALTTAAQVATAIYDAIVAAAEPYISASDATGSVLVTCSQTGAPTWARHNAAENGNGSATLAEVSAAVESSYQSKYITLRSGADSAFNAWFSVDALGSDPSAPGTAIPVSLTSTMSVSSVASAIASAIDANANFEAVADSPRVSVTASAKGVATDAGAGTAPVTVSVQSQGSVAHDYPSQAVDSLSNNPSVF